MVTDTQEKEKEEDVRKTKNVEILAAAYGVEKRTRRSKNCSKRQKKGKETLKKNR